MSHLKRVTTTFTSVPGAPYYSTIYGHENGESAADFQAAVGAFWTAVTANVCIYDLDFVTSGIMEVVESTTGLIVALDDSGTDVSGSGNVGADPIAWSSQMLCQVRTGHYVSGRELRGRIFVPAIWVGTLSAGSPSSTAKGHVQDALDELLTHQLAVYSPTHKEWASATAASVYGKYAVLRSRRD